MGPSLVVLLLFVGLVVFLVWLVRSRAADEGWSRAAESLGLRYSKRGLVNRRISGELGAHRVRVESYTERRGQSSKTYTRYQVLYEDRGSSFQLKRAGALSSLAEWAGRGDVKVGYKEFDEAVVVRASNPRYLRKYLTPIRRDLVQKTLTAHPRCSIENDRIDLVESGITSSHVEIEEVVRRFVRLADALIDAEEQVRDPPPRAEVRAAPAPVLPPVAAPEPPTPSEDEYEPAALVEDEAPPEPPVVPAAVEEELPPPPAPVEVEPAPSRAADAPSAAVVAQELFSREVLGVDAQRRFDAELAGSRARWDGELVRIDPYSVDSVFGGRPGARVLVRVHAFADEGFGEREVHAVLGLDRERADGLADRIGSTLRFDGTLVRCDPYLRHLFVTEVVLSE